MIITLARLEESTKANGEYRYAGVGNFQPLLDTTKKPVAMVYKSEANEEDLKRAKAFAKREGYQVYQFPDDEEDPLGKSKAQLRRS